MFIILSCQFRGGILLFFGTRRSPSDARAVAQELRDGGVPISGPYRTRKGLFVFSVAGRVVKAEELQELGKSGELHAERVQKFLERIAQGL